MSDIKVWTITKSLIYNSYEPAEQFILKSDHDLTISKKDLEIKMLREQRNSWIDHHLIYAARKMRTKSDYESEITAALEKL